MPPLLFGDSLSTKNAGMATGNEIGEYIPDGVRDLFPIPELSNKPLDEDKEIKCFRYAIGDIQLHCEHDLSSTFLVVEVGGRQHDTSLDRESQAYSVELDMEPEVGMKERKSTIKHVGKQRYVHYTQCKKEIRARNKSTFSDTFNGTWRGSLGALRKEDMRVTVWSRNLFGGNIFVGAASRSLAEIASSPCIAHVDLFFDKTDEVPVCHISMTFLFEEIADFVLELRDWEMSQSMEVAPGNEQNNQENIDLQASSTVSQQARYLKFAMPSRGFLSHVLSFFEGILPQLDGPFWPIIWPLSLLLSFKGAFVSPIQKRSSDAVVQLAGESSNASKQTRLTDTLHYRGTRTDLESQSAKVEVLNAFNIISQRRWMTLRDVLEYGYLHIPLQNAGKRITSLKGQLSLVNTLPKMRQHGAGSSEFDDASLFQVLASTLLCCFDFSSKYAAQETAYLKISLQRGKGFRSIEYYRETLNTFAAVEWMGQKRRSSTFQGSTFPQWNETLLLQCPSSNESKTLSREVCEPVVFQVWDVEGATEQLLGHCEVPFRDLILHMQTKRGKVMELQLLNPKDTESSTKMCLDIRIEQKGLNVSRLLEQSYAESKSTALSNEMNQVTFARAMRAWNQILHTCRWNIGLGINIDPFREHLPSGKRFFLPRFLTNIHAPKFDTQHSKTNLETLLFYYVYCLSCTEQNEESQPRELTQDPASFLKSKKGSTLDHAILLACFLLDLEQYRGKAYVCIGAKKDDQNNLTKYACVLTADAPHKFRLWDTETGTTTILDAFRALEGTNTSLVSTREDGVSQKARDAVPKAFSVLQRNQSQFPHSAAESRVLRADSIHIYAIFNESSIFANLGTSDIDSMDFSFSNETKWFRFPYPSTSVATPLSCFYQMPCISGPLGRKSVSLLEAQLKSQLCVSIRQFRELHLCETSTVFVPEDISSGLRRCLMAQSQLRQQAIYEEIQKDRNVEVYWQDVAWFQKDPQQANYGYEAHSFFVREIRPHDVARTILNEVGDLFLVTNTDGAIFFLECYVEALPAEVLVGHIVVGVLHAQ